MGSARITRVVVDEKALEEAMQRGKGTRAAVNERARKIRDAANSASRHSARTPLFIADSSGKPVGTFTGTGRKPNPSWVEAHPGAQVLGGRVPIYNYKPADKRDHAVAIVYTSNYAAMKHEHQTNTLMKMSRS